MKTHLSFVPQPSISQDFEPQVQEKHNKQHAVSAIKRQELIEELHKASSFQKNNLAQCSLLNQIQADIPEIMVFDDPALSTICLGPASYKTRSGWNKKSGAKYFATLFGLFKNGKGVFTKDAFPELLADVCQKLDDFYTDERSTQEKAALAALAIAGLPTGQSYVLPCGWAGHPAGHEMLLRFEKDPEGKSCYNVYLYDGTPAIAAYVGRDLKAITSKCVPVCGF